MKKHFLALAILAATAPSASAQISNDVVRIGVLTDLSSWGRDNSGPGSVEAAKMAVEEFGPTVLGKPIEIVSADHQMKTDVGLQIARDWFDNGKVDAIAENYYQLHRQHPSAWTQELDLRPFKEEF